MRHRNLVFSRFQSRTESTSSSSGIIEVIDVDIIAYGTVSSMTPEVTIVMLETDATISVKDEIWSGAVGSATREVAIVRPGKETGPPQIQ